MNVTHIKKKKQKINEYSKNFWIELYILVFRNELISWSGRHVSLQLHKGCPVFQDLFLYLGDFDSR